MYKGEAEPPPLNVILIYFESFGAELNRQLAKIVVCGCSDGISFNIYVWRGDAGAKSTSNSSLSISFVVYLPNGTLRKKKRAKRAKYSSLNIRELPTMSNFYTLRGLKGIIITSRRR